MKKISKHPSVSVIIPTYNRGWILKQAVESVLAQDFGDYELIVVDDGSTNNSQEMLQSYRQDLIVLRQNNQGVSAARNRGIAEASGQLVAFLDSDDLWLPNKLSHQVGFFKDNPDAVIHQTQEIWIRNGVRVNPKKRHHKFSGMIFITGFAPIPYRCRHCVSGCKRTRKNYSGCLRERWNASSAVLPRSW